MLPMKTQKVKKKTFQTKYYRSAPKKSTKQPSITKNKAPDAILVVNDLPNQANKGRIGEINKPQNVNQMLQKQVYGPCSTKQMRMEINNSRGLEVPFNKRLSCSTPVEIPNMSAGSAEIQMTEGINTVQELNAPRTTTKNNIYGGTSEDRNIKGLLDTFSSAASSTLHALNSFNIVNAVKDPKEPEPIPRVTQGHVEFAKNPTQCDLPTEPFQPTNRAMHQFSLYSENESGSRSMEYNRLLSNPDQQPGIVGEKSVRWQTDSEQMAQTTSPMVPTPSMDGIGTDLSFAEKQTLLRLLQEQRLLNQGYVQQEQLIATAIKKALMERDEKPTKEISFTRGLGQNIESDKHSTNLDKEFQPVEDVMCASLERDNHQNQVTTMKDDNFLTRSSQPPSGNKVFGVSKRVATTQTVKKKKRVPKKKSTPPSKKAISSHEEVDSKNDSADPLVSPQNDDPCLSRPKIDCSQLKSNMPHLKQLLRELRTVGGMNKDLEVKRLARELEEVIVKKIHVMDWQVEWDLAMQPLRSENTQLRRRIRIFQQQLNEKVTELEQAERIDPSFQVVHLQMVVHNLEKQLKDERESRERIHQRVSVLQQENAKVLQEKLQLVQLMGSKDEEQLNKQKQFTEKKNILLVEMDSLKKEKNEFSEKMEEMQQKNQVLQVELEGRHKEIVKMQELVFGLQTSMKNLLNDFTSQSSPMVDANSPSHLSTSIDCIHSCLNRIGDAVATKPGKAKPVQRLTGPATLTKANLAAFTRDRTTVMDPQPLKQPDQSSKVYTKQSMKEPDKVQQKSKTNTLPQMPKGQHQTASTMSSPFHLDQTDYLLPKGMSPFLKPKYAYQTAKEPSPLQLQPKQESPTVGELLTPLAEQMNKIQKYSEDTEQKLRAARMLNFDDQEGDAVDDKSCDSEVLSESESDTLGEEKEVGVVDQESESIEETIAKSVEQSRFSVTDYFKKYSSAPDASYPPRDEEVLSLQSIETLTTTDEGDEEEEQEEENEENRREWSEQHGVYRGTALDVSLSSIDEAGTLKDTATCTSVDDHRFQQGLANLDVNIAKIQMALREAMPAE